jgi:hypothetical protein
MMINDAQPSASFDAVTERSSDSKFVNIST